VFSLLALLAKSDNVWLPKATMPQNTIDHYENFPVASWLCPARLRPAVMAIYHFARTADDLADEGDAPASQRLEDLSEYRADLAMCMVGRPSPQSRWSALFAGLHEAIQAYTLPTQPLFDLLEAFEQDIVYTDKGEKYRTRAELLDYCRRSANPVGRLMLHLYGVQDAQSLEQSDAICSALQLINFWQDRTRDLALGRDYLPRDSTFAQELQFARTLMAQGAPLVHRVPGRAGWELRAMVQGGLCILGKVDVLYAKNASSPLPRPVITKWDMGGIAWKCLWM
jgi:phytoene/squalene synthetase